MRLVVAAAAVAAAVARGAPAYTNPFCGNTTARNTPSVTLACAPGAGDIVAVGAAFYDTPDLSRGCGAWARGACDLAGFAETAAAACVGRPACVVAVSGATPDPCAGVIKTVAVEATCASAPGCAQVPNPSPTPSPTPPPPPPFVPTPSCATQNGDPPCPLPQWAASWALNRSIVTQPGNVPGFLNASAAARFGLVSLDWSVASAVWRPGGAAQACATTTGAATLVEQCRQIKAVDATTRCFVYRNTILFLEWLEPQRSAMQDPTRADYFLQYQPGNPSRTPPGTIYSEVARGPGDGCQQYFLNYSNPDAFAYALAVSEQGALGTASPFVDGTFLDDSQALPQEHPLAPGNMGLSPMQLATLQNDTHRFVQTAIETLAAQGHYIWQGFDGNRAGDPDGVAPAPTRADCAAYMAELCAPSWQQVPMTLNWDGRNTTLAAFLIGRGPVAYVGKGWTGGVGMMGWDPRFDLNVGEPAGLCAQHAPGVFSRAWTRGEVVLDCNEFSAVLPFSY